MHRGRAPFRKGITMAKKSLKAVSLCQQLADRLDNIDVGVHNRPKTLPSSRQENFGVADDYVQKRFVLREKLRRELRAPYTEHERLKVRVRHALGSEAITNIDDRDRLVIVARDPLFIQLVTDLKDLTERVTPLIEFSRFVDHVYRAEIRCRFPKIRDKKVSIDQNWNIFHMAEEAAFEDIFGELLRGDKPRGTTH